jgi:Protein of unknown function with PCYCGC motif
MRIPLLAAGTILALGVVAAAPAKKPAPAKPPAAPATHACATCSEKGAVLDPNLFSDSRFEPEAKASYEVAQKYPKTLDQLHCFCECQESMTHRHKTLLTCFTSNHAAGCGICMREALLAGELKDKGTPDDQIESTVESVFKTDGHRPTKGPG